MGGDSQWQFATTDESQQCAFKTYKRRDEERRLTLKMPFRLFKKGHWKQWMEISPKTSPSSQLCYSEGTVLIVQIFISSTQKVTELFLSWIVCFLVLCLATGRNVFITKASASALKEKLTDISGIFDLTSNSRGVLSRQAQMTVRQVYTSSLDSLKMLTELGRLDLWQ